MPGDEAPAGARWRRLVSDRLEEMQRLSPQAGSLDGAFWDRLAERYAATPQPDGEPFLRHLRAVAEPSSTALDVGAGSGRFALALASELAHVTAVDPSAGMLAILEREAAKRRLGNVTTVRATWKDAEVDPADIAFSSFVLTLVPDARAFVTKLEDAARRHVFLYLGAYSGDAVLDPLWRHFHGAPRAPGPTYLDALALLREIGIEPEVKVVEIPNRRRFATVREAVDHYRDGLLLADTPDVNGDLEAILSVWLLGRRGAWRSPLRSVPAAIIHWTPPVEGR